MNLLLHSRSIFYPATHDSSQLQQASHRTHTHTHRSPSNERETRAQQQWRSFPPRAFQTSQFAARNRHLWRPLSRHLFNSRPIVLLAIRSDDPRHAARQFRARDARYAEHAREIRSRFANSRECLKTRLTIRSRHTNAATRLKMAAIGAAVGIRNGEPLPHATDCASLRSNEIISELACCALETALRPRAINVHVGKWRKSERTRDDVRELRALRCECSTATCAVVYHERAPRMRAQTHYIGGIFRF